jgi:hypothetical protein
VAEAETRRLEAEARKNESEAQKGEIAGRWRERLDAMERACVEYIEKSGTALKSAETTDRKMAVQGRNTAFTVALSLTLEFSADKTARTCHGVFGGNKVTIAKVE